MDMFINFNIFILILIFIYLISNINFSHKNEKFMNLQEILEFNIKLFLISNAGLIDLKENESKILETISNDEIMIKNHRKLQSKYNKYIKTYIITKSINYFS